MELPIPSIDKQREIVKEYKTVVNRIRLNERLNEKLEETAQAIYKQWFVEFEFPMTAEYAESIGKPELAGQPYKSSGGEMEYNEVLEQDIPKGWRDRTLRDVANIYDNVRVPLSGEERAKRPGNYPYYGAMSIMDYIDDYLFDGIYLLMSEDGVGVVNESGNPALQYVWGKFWVNNHAHILQGKDGVSTEFLYMALKKTYVAHLVTGAAQPKINQANMASIATILPDQQTLHAFDEKTASIWAYIRENTDMTHYLADLREMLLLRLSNREFAQ